jgi:hypothetical protein
VHISSGTLSKQAVKAVKLESKGSVKLYACALAGALQHKPSMPNPKRMDAKP